MGEAQKRVAELDVDEVFIGCLLWLLVCWCLVKGIGVLVGSRVQRVLLYYSIVLSKILLRPHVMGAFL